MTDRHDIWHRLKDHETPPPHEVFGRLQQLLETGDAVSVPPAGDLFERLQQHEIKPPPGFRRQIEQQAGVKQASPVSRRWYLAAAACLALAIAGWLMYSNDATKVSIVKKTQPPATSKTPSPADTFHGKGDTSAGLAGAMTTDSRPAARGEISVRQTFNIEGQTISVTDNDLLVTFTSFTYPDVPAYLTRNTGKPLKISIDQYTQLYVSQRMLDMMKVTYQVLPNGKPARKARKMKRRLDSWKEKDQKQFDKGKGANPLDPVDLAEFIFR